MGRNHPAREVFAVNESRETLGQMLQRLRIEAGLTQEQLAEKAELPVFSLRNWEYDQRSPRSAALLRLAEALDVQMEELVRAAARRFGRQPVRESSELRAMKRAWDRASAADRDSFRAYIAQGEHSKRDRLRKIKKSKKSGKS